jgi:O-acetyl-ADP-ribose deacetylase (regulator of RNase III)
MSVSVSINDVLIRVVKGDITKLEVDAIVNPANSLMIMGGGVAGAIRRAGGKVIEDEARKHAPVAVGNAIATTAGALSARYVIHSPTMERPAMRTSPEKVAKATRAALKLADELGIKSLAFPGMGTGVGGVNPAIAANVMINEITNHIQKGTLLREIILVAYDDTLFDAFRSKLKELGR